jgi:hypothetical protein
LLNLNPDRKTRPTASTTAFVIKRASSTEESHLRVSAYRSLETVINKERTTSKPASSKRFSVRMVASDTDVTVARARFEHT